MTNRCLAWVLVLSGMAGAQTATPLVLESFVRETLTTLAADEMAGRDTPSPELERAAAFIAQRFAESGLENLPGLLDYRHRYQLPGERRSNEDVQVQVSVDGRTLRLEPERDFRLWKASGSYQGEMEAAARMKIEDAGNRNLFGGRSSPTPLFLEVDASDPLWRAAASPRARLSARRRRSSAPQFLVRRGLIPDGEIKATIKVPEALDIEVDLSNVVGLLRGTKRPDEFVVFSAHYDHIGVGLPVRGDSINNGADDDATGTTAVMELARYFAASGALDRSLLFVAFSAEEQGLRGSRAFAENPPVPLEQIVANVNIEMIGRPEEGKAYKAWVTGTGRSDFVDYARRAFERAGLGIVEFKMGDQLFRQSDNWSLAQKGVVAHSLSAGSLHQDYHKPSDEVSRIEIEHMTAIIRGLAELGRELAAAQGRPQWTK